MPQSRPRSDVHTALALGHRDRAGDVLVHVEANRPARRYNAAGRYARAWCAQDDDAPSALNRCGEKRLSGAQGGAERPSARDEVAQTPPRVRDDLDVADAAENRSSLWSEMQDGAGYVPIPILMLLAMVVLLVFQLWKPAFFVRLQAKYIVFLAKSLGFLVDPVPISVGRPERLVRRQASILLAVAIVLSSLLLARFIRSR
jgi:hypothetical protein